MAHELLGAGSWPKPFPPYCISPAKNDIRAPSGWKPQLKSRNQRRGLYLISLENKSWFQTREFWRQHDLNTFAYSILREPATASWLPRILWMICSAWSCPRLPRAPMRKDSPVSLLTEGGKPQGHLEVPWYLHPVLHSSAKQTFSELRCLDIRGM